MWGSQFVHILATLVIACVFLINSYPVGMKQYLIVVIHNFSVSVWYVLNFKILFLLCMYKNWETFKRPTEIVSTSVS